MENISDISGAGTVLPATTIQKEGLSGILYLKDGLEGFKSYIEQHGHIIKQQKNRSKNLTRGCAGCH